MTFDLLHRYRLLVAAAALALLLGPTAAVADDFDFGDDDAFDFGDDDAFDFGDDDAFDFGEDEAFDFGEDDAFDFGEEDAAPVRTERRVTALLLPGGPLEPRMADELTEEVLGILPSLEGRNIIVQSNQGLREEFEIMGSDLAYECAFDPVCLGRYGRELGIDEVVVGRASVSATGQWEVTINRLQTENNAIINYRFFTTESRTSAVADALPNQLRLLYGLRPERQRDTEESSGRWQRAVAWSTLAGSAVALGLGIYFGTQATALDDDLQNTPSLPGYQGELVPQRTQRDVEDDIQKAQRQAAMANVMFATAAGLAAVSTVFFLVRPGSDIDLDADLVQAPGGQIGFSPAAGLDGFGVSGRLRFR